MDANYLIPFTGLVRLMVEGVERSNIDALVQLTEYEQLLELHCNLFKLNSTDLKPNDNQLAFLERLYQRLRQAQDDAKTEHLVILREGKPVLDDRLEYFFNHVQLDLAIPFADYHFEEPLIDLHYRNIVQKGVALVPCRSVTELNYLDLFKNYLHSMPGSEVQEAQTIFSILKFLRLYPSIRVVAINNAGSRTGPNPRLFVDLLKDCCRALTELRIQYCDFDADFYIDLAQVRSVSQSLDRLTVMGACPSRRLIDLDSLLDRFPRLHQLTTNVCGREMMIKVAGKMQFASSFEITFWEGTEEAAFYCCEIRKADGDDYRLDVRRIMRDDSPELRVYSSRLPLHSLAAYFNKPGNAYVTAHWHDTLKQPKLVVRSKVSTRST